MKLIVLCLSLFLVSHSIFAQSSDKQAKYEKLKQKMAILNDTIGKLEKQINLNKEQMADLKFYKDSRDVLDRQIQGLEKQIQEEKVEMFRKEISEGVKEMQGGRQNMQNKIYELTEDLYARKISVDEYWRRIERLLFDISNRQSAYNYAYDFFENKNIEISNKIEGYDSEMKNIKENLSSFVYNKTGLKNVKIKKNPNDPYAFSNGVNKIYYDETGKYLPESTKKEIQEMYDTGATIYADRASKKENAKNQYSYNQDVLKELRSLCRECK